VNPFYAPEPLSPHEALLRAKITFRKEKVFAVLKRLQARYDIVLVEGAAGCWCRSLKIISWRTWRGTWTRN